MPIVYRDSRAAVEIRPALERLRRRAADEAPLRHIDTPLGLLIDIAEFECAAADAICPDRDTASNTTAALRDASCEAATLWLDTREGRADSRALAAALSRIPVADLPPHGRMPVSEGFAYYALFPETYAISARRMVADLGCRDICAVGLRSIGTCLAAVVSAALRGIGCRSSSFTVRPRGHPFARQLCLDQTIVDALRGEAERGACFAVVDEGPGISGSSFAAAVSALAGLGVPSDRICLLPSWLPAAEALCSATARAMWSSQRKYVTPSEEAGATALSAFGVTSHAIDFSAGRWRRTIFPDATATPDVQPQHERVKWFVPSEKRLLKFAGLGRYGLAALRRADGLADARLGERPGQLRNGFIDLPFIPGTPLARCDDDETARQVGTYLGRVAATFPAREPPDVPALAEMVAHNTRELLGKDAPPPPRRIGPAVELDGRMLAHEWIRPPGGRLVKVDALDHHRDHFFPGVQPAAWDLAGAMTELRMNERHRAALLDRYEAVSGDRAARSNLPYYRLAYAVFRAGYCTLANLPSRRYSQCALNAIACFSASSKSPRKQIARSSMNT